MIPEADTADTFALVVGIRTYHGNPGWDLPEADRRAADFTEWLRDRNVPPENILLFLSPLPPGGKVRDVEAIEATHDRIRFALYTRLPELKGRLLFIFWVGHGQKDSEDRQRLSYVDSSRTKTDLDFDSFRLRLRTADYTFACQVGIVDACSDYAAIEYHETFKPTRLPLPRRKQFVVYSAQAGQKAAASVFAGYLLAELNGSTNGSWPDMREVTKAAAAPL
jgi:hypothetical protein